METVTNENETLQSAEITEIEDTGKEQAHDENHVEETPLHTEPCDSCGTVTELFDVPHHQSGNAKIWKYCARCKALHDKEVSVAAELKELALTHPQAANDPTTAGKLHQGISVSEIKAELDRNKQPE